MNMKNEKMFISHYCPPFFTKSISHISLFLFLCVCVLCHDHGSPQLPSFCCSQQHLLFYNTVFAVLVPPLRLLAVSLELDILRRLNSLSFLS